jgi:hypothetical protein
MQQLAHRLQRAALQYNQHKKQRSICEVRSSKAAPEHSSQHKQQQGT